MAFRFTPHGLLMQCRNTEVCVNGVSAMTHMLCDGDTISHDSFSATIALPVFETDRPESLAPIQDPNPEVKVAARERQDSVEVALLNHMEDVELGRKFNDTFQRFRKVAKRVPDFSAANQDAIVRTIDAIERDIERLEQMLTSLHQEPPQYTKVQPIVPSRFSGKKTQQIDLLGEPNQLNSESKNDQLRGPSLSSVLARLDSDSVDSIDVRIEASERRISNTELLNFDSYQLKKNKPIPSQIDVDVMKTQITVSDPTTNPVAELDEVSFAQTLSPGENDHVAILESRETGSVEPIEYSNESVHIPAAKSSNLDLNQPSVNPFVGPPENIGLGANKDSKSTQVELSPENQFEIDSIRLKLNQVFGQTQNQYQAVEQTETHTVTPLPQTQPANERVEHRSAEIEQLQTQVEQIADNNEQTGVNEPSLTAIDESVEANEPAQLFQTVSPVVASSGLATAAFLKQIEDAAEFDEPRAVERRAEPTPKPVQNPVSQEPGRGEDVDDYMNSLFKRLRGGDAKYEPAQPVAKPEVAKNQFVQESPRLAAAVDLMKDGEFVPMQAAPERRANIDALRKIANDSTRTAIMNFTEQQKKSLKAIRIASIGGGVILSALFFALSQEFGDPMSFGGMLSMMGVFASIGFQVYSTHKEKMSEEESKSAKKAPCED